MLERFELLAESEQSTLTQALERVVELIGAHALDASAILDVQTIPHSPKSKNKNIKQEATVNE